MASEPPATPVSERDWESLLSAELECQVEVIYGRARTTPIQVRPVRLLDRPPARGGAREGLRVRMHVMFAHTPPDVRIAVAKWIRSGRRARKACAALDAWIQRELEALPPKPATQRRLRPQGEHYDLDVLAAPLYETVFASDFAAGDARPKKTWGRRGRSRTRHSLRLGSYEREANEVRIHAALDQPGVPEWFVRYVLFHEILHAALPAEPGAGARWIHHGPEFKRREADYVDYERALAWEEKNLARLISSARRGVWLPVPRTRRAVPALSAALRYLQHELFR